MDQVTQQNAALVEEAAAAAGSLQDQSSHLANVVSVFKLDNNNNIRTAPGPVSPMAISNPVSNPAGKQRPALLPAKAHSHTAPRGIASHSGKVPVEATSANGWEEF
jgi:methyl-accepting chemotaxis protein